MDIKSFVMFLGVNAMLWCVLDAAVNTGTCTTDTYAVSLTTLSITPNQNIPVFGGERTFSGSISVNTGSSQISSVVVRLGHARVINIPILGTMDLCQTDDATITQLCSTNGKEFDCSLFETFLGVTNLCSNGNFLTSDQSFSKVVTIPNNIPSALQSLLGTVSATGQARVIITAGGTTIGCFDITVDVN